MKPVYNKQLREFSSTLDVYYCSRKSFLTVARGFLEDADLDEFSKMIHAASGYFLASDTGMFIIWICSDLKSTKEVLSAPAHETHHLSSHVNEHHDLSSEEYCAYLEGDVVSSVFMKIRKRLK